MRNLMFAMVVMSALGGMQLLSAARAAAAGCKNCSCVTHCRKVWCPGKFVQGKKITFGHWERQCSCYKPR
jgi:hypothetical protein